MPYYWFNRHEFEQAYIDELAPLTNVRLLGCDVTEYQDAHLRIDRVKVPFFTLNAGWRALDQLACHVCATYLPVAICYHSARGSRLSQSIRTPLQTLGIEKAHHKFPKFPEQLLACIGPKMENKTCIRGNSTVLLLHIKHAPSGGRFCKTTHCMQTRPISLPPSPSPSLQRTPGTDGHYGAAQLKEEAEGRHVHTHMHIVQALMAIMLTAAC